MCRSCELKAFSALLSRSQYPEILFSKPLFSICYYQDPWARLIKVFKAQVFEEALPELRIYFQSYVDWWLGGDFSELGFDAVVSVPPNPWRHYSQSNFAAFLSELIARSCSKPHLNILSQKAFSPRIFFGQQKNRKASLRGKELSVNDFSISKKKHREKRILLVDDIVRSGRSMDLSRKILEQQGYFVVACFSFARTQNLK